MRDKRTCLVCGKRFQPAKTGPFPDVCGGRDGECYRTRERRRRRNNPRYRNALDRIRHGYRAAPVR